MARTLNSPKFTGRGPLPETNPFDYDPPATSLPNAATHKQIMFLCKIASERGINLIGIVCRANDDGTMYFDPQTGEVEPMISKRDASQGIDKYLSMPKVAPAPGAKTTGKKITEDGMYRIPETGEIFKVQRAVHGSGNLYAKKLVIVDPNPPAVVRFDYASGMVYRLRPEWKMTLEEAKAFGTLYGTCCVCGRTLTNEESIEAGIGPVCGSRF